MLNSLIGKNRKLEFDLMCLRKEEI